ncbi:hypothetical protein [Luteipulveratus mongoliensis]|uniref:Uncharacterized protein n=1 Tax=Luteipulveratus mongoliensis TaxID=571913 RepID=A0A0K1JGM1_9MICO|nr:hypothetical protein [Luteipulveratus mongoliensis]AKU15735.1 hypothetical protein VV02_07540 [Luteipulveratus mongoliensis]
MTLNLSPKVRKVAYVATAVGAPVVAYLNAKGYIGELEVALWSGEVAVVNILAALNVPASDQEL